MTAPTLVQDKLGAAGGNSVVLTSTPTPGNYLLLWKAQHNAVDPVLQTGFTNLAVVTNNTGHVRRGRLQYRLVQPGDTVDIALSSMGQSANQYYIQEWTGVSAIGTVSPLLKSQNTQPSSTPFTCGGLVTPTTGVDSTVCGFAQIYQGGNEPRPTSITPSASVTERVDTADGGNHDVVWAGYRAITSPSGSYTVGGTVNAGDARPVSYCGVTVVLTGGVALPIADFVADDRAITEGGAVGFTDLPQGGTPTSWLWDFGDGSTSTSQNPTHTYSVAGTYTVTLTETNATGSDSETKTGYIVVSLASAPEPPPPANAIVEIYASDANSARWDQVNWDEAVWSQAAWQDVTPQSVEATILWGSSEPELGILSRPSAGSWSIDTYDPNRLLDPANEDGPYFGDLEPGLPIRISHRSVVIRQGIVESMSYGFADDRGFIRVQDNIAPLANAKVPPDIDLGDTLYARARAAIAAAGLQVTVLADPPTGDPALVPWVTGTTRTAWQWIQDAAESVLHIPYIDRIGRLGFRAWASPLVRARDLTATEMIDLVSLVQYDGLYSVVNALDDDGVTVVERASTPPPRYGARTYSRNSATPDVADWLEAVLADRVRSGRRWIPGTIFPLTAESVEKYATIEAVETISLSHLYTDPIVAQDIIIVGGKINITAKKDDESKWWFDFQAAETVQSPLITEDGAGFVVSEDGSVFLYPE